MSETKLSSMTPETREWIATEARKVLAECAQSDEPAGFITDHEGRAYARTVNGRVLASLDTLLEIAAAESESEAASAAFLRGFEAARERAKDACAESKMSIHEIAQYGDLARWWDDGVSAVLDKIRALTPADARASSIPGAASETDLAKGQSTEGAQPPGISSDSEEVR